MQRFREGLEARPEEFLKLAARVRRDTGMEISGEQYRRRKPCPDARLEPYYHLKNVLCRMENPIGPELFSPPWPIRWRRRCGICCRSINIVKNLHTNFRKLCRSFPPGGRKLRAAGGFQFLTRKSSLFLLVGILRFFRAEQAY